MATATSKTSTHISSFLSLSVTNRWGGMIEETFYKKARNSLFQLFSFVYRECDATIWLHNIISFIRIIQFVGPALFCSFPQIWVPNTVPYTVMNLISIFFHIIPPMVRDESFMIVLSLYIVILLGFFVFLGVDSFYYRSNGNLPSIVPRIIYYFVSTVGFIIHPIAFQLCGEFIGNTIENNSSYSVASTVVISLFVVGIYAAYTWLIKTVITTSIMFNPTSLITVLGTPQLLIFISTNAITIILGIASKLGKVASIVLIVIALCMYAASSFIPFINGGFIITPHSMMIMATSLFGTIACAGAAVFIALGIEANEISIFVLAIIWVICYVIAYWFIISRKDLSLRILDSIEEDKENVSYIKGPMHFTNIIVTGFSAAHPLCMSKDIFERSIDTWKTNVNIWVLYAKFVAIYPEEVQKLGWIQHQMMALGLKGATSKHVQEEILHLMRTRESNISPELKKKLNKINKKVQLVKNKLRHIWDLVIQGNIGDIGSFIEKTYESEQSVEAEFNHILSQYPNSRFVARTYARFCIEIKADHQKFAEWAEKAKMLQLGNQVAQDHTHELGLTFFPNIADTINRVNESPQIAQDSGSQILDFDGESDDKSQIVVEQSISLREQINELTIPSILVARISRFIVLFVLFLIPLVTASFVIYAKLAVHKAPLEYLVYISRLRASIFSVPSCCMRYINEELGFMASRKTVLGDEGKPLAPLGNTWKLSEQLSFYLNDLTDSVQKLSGFRTLERGNKEMDLAREELFGNNIDYTFFTSKTENQTTKASVIIGAIEFVSQISNVLNVEITPDIFETSMIANPTANARKLAKRISTAESLIIKNMKMSDNSIRELMFFVTVSLSIVISIVLICIVAYEISITGKNNTAIFKCLTSLPKNVVSTVADSLKVMKNEHSESMSRTEDSEMNKQEENMMKIFATASDANGKISGQLLKVICTILSIIIFIGMNVVLYLMFDNMSTSVYGAAPSLDNLMGAYAYQSHMILDLMIIASDNKGYKVLGSDTLDMIQDSYKSMLTSLEYFQNARFGKEDGSETPFKELNAGILQQDKLMQCDTTNLTKPDKFSDAYNCLSLELLFYAIENFLYSLIEPMKQRKTNFTPDNEILWNMYEIETVYIYSKFFYPIFSNIVPSVDETLLSDITIFIIIAYALFAAEIIVEIVVLYDNVKENNHMHFALSLLLHCPPSSVTQIPLVSNVLSGNFNLIKGDTATKNQQFFDEVLENFPDPLIISDESGTIVKINKSSIKFFGDMNLIGQKIQNFFASEAFANTATNIRKQAPQEEDVLYNTSDTTLNINIKSLSFNQMTAYILRDITQTVRYNTLIDEERAKSDRLLESILPAKLVKRVQQGEKNISFSVQSASVVFMDIVSFTPWCGSNPANFVMDTLNKLYKEFDSLVAKYPTMTRIKCIGDCYMAAGGIFSDMNQPAVHAKEIVEFGIDAINAIGPINKETNQSLQIRVGINTGGPIIAGVLGSGKPTFEILGPAINMAQQMEHNGIPMQVHISRAVYELIYGGNFKIKERGQIEIKNGTVVTYLVSP